VYGGSDTVMGTGHFNPWTNAISTAGFVTVAPGGTDSTTAIAVNSAEAALTPTLGLMVVTLDNKSGFDEAQLLFVKTK